MSGQTPPRDFPGWVKHWPAIVAGALMLGLVVVVLVLAFT